MGRIVVPRLLSMLAAEFIQQRPGFCIQRALRQKVGTSQPGPSQRLLQAPAADPPIFSPAVGSYSTAQTVRLTDSTPHAKIYYTTDGSMPTTASSVYSGPITVSANQLVQAVAKAPGYSLSAVAGPSFILTPQASNPAISRAGESYSPR